jgi:hypothetical protein
MTNPLKPTPIVRWGKDHWSLLAYVECVCVDGSDTIGAIDKRRVRCNPATHPLHNAVFGVPWKPEYGTRLRGFFDFPNRADAVASEMAGLQLLAHDDWDCLDDLEAAGLVEIISTTNGFVRMTKTGIAESAALREHKISGGNFANFPGTTTTQPVLA